MKITRVEAVRFREDLRICHRAEAPGVGIEIREEAFRNGDAVIETIAEL